MSSSDEKELIGDLLAGHHGSGRRRKGKNKKRKKTHRDDEDYEDVFANFDDDSFLEANYPKREFRSGAQPDAVLL